jgi:hypothetical protein
MADFREGFDNKSSSPVLDNVRKQFQPTLSAKPTAKYASGPRCILKVNSKICGFAFGVSWRITTMASEINTIDDPFAYELAPQRISVEGTISALHIPGEGIGVKLWQPDVLNFLFQQYITIEVRDSVTDKLLFFTDKAVITSRQEDIRVDSLASVQLSWRAIGFKDEREPTLPDNLRDVPSDESALRGLTDVLRNPIGSIKKLF